MSTGTITRSHGYFEGVGRLRLHYRAWEVPNARAAIVLVHGLGDHGGRFAELAGHLAALGCSAFALDLRGHGRSDGRRGHVPRFEIYLQELDRFRREVHGLIDPDSPLFLLGHSMGGLVALRYLEEFETAFRGAIISSPWLATAIPVPRWKSTLAGALNRLLPAFPFAAGIRAEELSHDPERVAAYRNDPLVHGTVTPRLFAEASAAMGLVLQRSDRLRVPLLFLLAGKDRIVDTQRTVGLARSLPAHGITIHLFPDAYHEVLGETEREAAFSALHAWLLERMS